MDKTYLFQARYITPIVDYFTFEAPTEEEAREEVAKMFKAEASLQVLRVAEVEKDNVQEIVDGWSSDENGTRVQ